jgi:hypothetical protein
MIDPVFDNKHYNTASYEHEATLPPFIISEITG